MVYHIVLTEVLMQRNHCEDKQFVHCTSNTVHMLATVLLLAQCSLFSHLYVNHDYCVYFIQKVVLFH